MLFIPAAHPIPHQCVIQADGYWENPRFVTVVNGSLPGPTIEVYEGQNVIVHVKNSLKSQCTVIHWHGLHQKGKLSYTLTRLITWFGTKCVPNKAVASFIFVSHLPVIEKPTLPPCKKTRVQEKTNLMYDNQNEKYVKTQPFIVAGWDSAPKARSVKKR